MSNPNVQYSPPEYASEATFYSVEDVPISSCPAWVDFRAGGGWMVERIGNATEDYRLIGFSGAVAHVSGKMTTIRFAELMESLRGAKDAR